MTARAPGDESRRVTEQRKLTTEDEDRHEPHGGLDAQARGEHNHMTLAETGDPVMRHPVEHMVTGALWSTPWRRQQKSKTLRGEQTTPWSSVALQLLVKGHYLRVAAKNSCNLVTIGTRTHYFERVARSIARLTLVQRSW